LGKLTNSTSEGVRVLLVNPTGWQKESVNLGLAYLAGALQKAGHRVLILDLILREMSDSELVDRVKTFGPALIGLSVKTAVAREAVRLAEVLSSVCPDVGVVAGGPHVTLCVEDYFNTYDVFDFGILGEAEESIVLLADALAGKVPTQDVPGLTYRANDALITNPWGPVKNLEQLALPDFDAIEGFSWKGFRYPILTSRGCPYQCVYCCVNKLTGSKTWRPRSAENVVDELEHVVHEKGITAFETWDDNFTLSVSRAKRICRELIDRKLGLSWYCHNGIRADRMDVELAEMMKKAGCTSVAFGMESGHPETFELIKKGEPLSAITEAVKTVKAAGIEAVGYFIIGLPGDTLDKFIETVRFQRAMNLDHTTFGMLVPYPKTEVWNLIHSRGRMLLDITQTQQFGQDVVPVAFEMPEFLQEDMINAFYISEYFELYEAVRRLFIRGEKPVVVYMESAEIAPRIPAMIAMCNGDVRHIIVRDSEMNLSHTYENEGAETVASYNELEEALIGGSTIFICLPKHINKGMMFSNSDIIIVSRRRSNQPLVEVRRSVKTVDGLSPVLVSFIANIVALRDNVKKFGLLKLLRALPRIVFRLLPKPMHTTIRKCRDTLPMPWHVACFVSAKVSLKYFSRQEGKGFPFDDHPTHM
jgi:anaerobic magnesium-protoporphyrin IX monomethyl ester cyclase